MNSLVISIDTEGTATCLHTDAIALHEIGRLEVRRASTVEFNPDTQRWEVRWPDRPAVVFSDPSRSVCIAWEVETINQVIALTGRAEA